MLDVRSEPGTCLQGGRDVSWAWNLPSGDATHPPKWGVGQIDTSITMHAFRNQPNSGFTLIELVVVIGVLMISTAIGVRSVGGMMGGRAVIGAQSTFSAYAARARLTAVQTGEETHFIANANSDHLSIEQNGDRLADIDLREEMGVDLQMTRDGVRICYDGRGLAVPACNSFSAPLVATMARGDHETQLRIHTFGQVTRKSK